MPAKNNKCCCDEGGSSSPSGSSTPSSSPSSSPSAPVSTVPCLTRCIDSVMAAEYEVTLFGITSGVCISYCPPLNGTWTIPMTGVCSGTVFIPTGAFCPHPSSSTSAWLTYQFSATQIVLTLTSGPSGVVIATWKKTGMVQPYDCLAAHVLTLATAFTWCNNLPATVTVSPV